MTTTTQIPAAASLFSAGDIAFYLEHGYVVMPGALDPKLLRRARATLAEFIAGARGLTEGNALYDLEPTHRPDAPRIRRMKQPHRNYAIFDEIMRWPLLVASLAQLIGPSIRFQNSKLNLKESNGGSPIEWHQDWAFFPHTNDDSLAVGVMLEDCYQENGPLLVIPGTHRMPIFDHHTDGVFRGGIDPTTMNGAYEKAVALTGPAGSLTFHHIRTVHGSAQNLSPFPRPLLLYQYKAADAWPLLGIPNLAEFDAGLITGEPTVQPRVESVPVRMPLPKPPPESQGNVYQFQAQAKNRYFSYAEPKE